MLARLPAGGHPTTEIGSRIQGDIVLTRPRARAEVVINWFSTTIPRYAFEPLLSIPCITASGGEAIGRGITFIEELAPRSPTKATN
jgi:hypothetical protein